MSTLSFQIENIENYDPDGAPDGDEAPHCPACGSGMDYVWPGGALPDALMCVNEECTDYNWYAMRDGQLVKIAPAY